MLTFPRLARLAASRSFRLAVFALSACVFAFALHLAWLAFSSPLESRVFRKYVADMTGGQPVFGEETHLFKSKYRGELVDAGDVVAAVARSGYFGDAFTRTYGRYTAQLASSPPRFVMGGLLSEATATRIMSGELQHLLGTHYKLRVMAKRTAFATAGSQALFERAD